MRRASACRLVVFLAASPLATVACGLLVTDTNGFELYEAGHGQGGDSAAKGAREAGGKPDGGPTRRPDASSETAPSDAIPDGGGASAGNLLVNPDFTDGTIGCGPGWQISANTTATFSSIAHGGKRSCLVCTNESGNGEGQIGQTVTMPFDAGTNLGFSAYVSAAPDAGVPATVMVLIDVYYGDGGVRFDYASDQSGVADGGWTLLAQSTTLTLPISGLFLRLFATSGPSCYLVDDVTLVVQ